MLFFHSFHTLGPRRGPTSTCWSEIADFAKYKREFFEKYIDLSNGLPTDDTLRRFFQNLKSFRIRFAEWASSIVHDSARGKVVKAKRPSRNPLARSCGSPAKKNELLLRITARPITFR